MRDFKKVESSSIFFLHRKTQECLSKCLAMLVTEFIEFLLKSLRDEDWKEIMSQSREIQSPNRDLPLP